MCNAVNRLFQRLTYCNNRELLYDLYSYMWDMRGVVSLLNSYVKWLGKFHYFCYRYNLFTQNFLKVTYSFWEQCNIWNRYKWVISIEICIESGFIFQLAKYYINDESLLKMLIRWYSNLISKYFIIILHYKRKKKTN